MFNSGDWYTGSLALPKFPDYGPTTRQWAFNTGVTYPTLPKSQMPKPLPTSPTHHNNTYPPTTTIPNFPHP